MTIVMTMSIYYLLYNYYHSDVENDEDDDDGSDDDDDGDDDKHFDCHRLALISESWKPETTCPKEAAVRTLPGGLPMVSIGAVPVFPSNS